MKRKLPLCAILSLLALLPLFGQFDSRFASPGASEQFRLGVQAYHRGRYSEAILLFEKSLAYSPEQSLVSYWLGRAYNKMGFGATSLRAWEPLLADPSSPPFLRAKVETLRQFQSVEETPGDFSYVEAARFQGKLGKNSYFSRPSAILPQPDGSFLVVAQGSNEILRIDANGVIKSRDRGGLAGYDRPFGLARLPDGTLFVTEFNGDRVTRLAEGKALRFGSKGRDDGRLLGPQYAACDGEGYLYVTDYGNARVVKFDPDGNFILGFGAKVDAFPGFVSPAGLAEKDGVLYVADSYRKAIYRFDSSGNYLGSLADGLLHYPEGLAFWQNGASLLVADTDRIVSIGLDDEALALVYQSPDKKARLVGAAADFNGNLLACDFDTSNILVLTEASLIAAGYDVEIERVYADAFPKVSLDLSVRDRMGRPVVGLGFSNFHLSERVEKTEQQDERGKTVLHRTESLVPVKDPELLASAMVSAPPRIALLLESSPAMNDCRGLARDAIAELFGELSNGGKPSFSLTLAGRLPSSTLPLGSGLADLTKAALSAPPASSPGRFDLGLHLAATDLLPSSSHDVVVYVGTGAVDEKSFTGTSLAELASLLRNNGISFYAIILGEGEPAPSLRYLSEQCGGSIYAASGPRGLKDLAASLLAASGGRYRLSFSSVADSRFGEAYLTIAAEAYLYKKSGRDELGYFAPLR
jgi:DNA-binding beta-propeller fold protein YncE